MRIGRSFRSRNRPNRKAQHRQTNNLCDPLLSFSLPASSFVAARLRIQTQTRPTASRTPRSILRQRKVSILSKVSGVIATQKSSKSISKPPAQINNQLADQSKHSTTRPTPAAPTSTIRNGKQSSQPHSTHG